MALFRWNPFQKKDDSALLLSLLQQLGDILASCEKVADFFDSSVRMIEQVLEVEGCSIFLLDPADDSLKLRAATRIPREEWSRISIKKGKGIVGQVAESGKMIWARDISKEKSLQASGRGETRYKTNSFISMPVKQRRETIGVINVDSKKSGKPFSKKEVETLRGLAGLFGAAWSNSMLLEERAKSTRHFDSILQSIPMGIMTFDADLHMTHCNRAAAEMLGLNTEDALGQTAHNAFPGALRPRILELITELRVTGIAACSEFEFKPEPDEKPRPMGLSAWGLSRMNGLREGIVIVMEDLSLRREISELREMSEMKSHFLSLISHELRTPLTSILPLLHIMRTGETDNLTPEQQRMLAIIDRNTRRLSSLVEDILEVQRIETEAIDLKRRPVDLEEMVREGLSRRKLAWNDKQIDTRLNVEGDSIGKISLDKDHIQQVCKHLLDNAFKFCDAKGRVDVDLRREGDFVELRISNTGPPIPLQHREQIFEKFYQIESTMTRKVGGAGMGLYLARRLARLHGGDVTLERSDEDGATFALRLPASIDSEKRQSKAADSGAGRSDTKQNLSGRIEAGR